MQYDARESLRVKPCTQAIKLLRSTAVAAVMQGGAESFSAIVSAYARRSEFRGSVPDQEP